MQPKELADALGVTSNTVRRWIAEFHRYLTPTAHPPKGKPRVLSAHDLRVLHYIAAARKSSQPMETIHARLDAMQADDWSGLPDTPPEWEHPEETIPLTVAASRAYDVAQVAVLQRDLEHARQELQKAAERAEMAESKVTHLEAQISELEASQRSTTANHVTELNAARLELERARGQVAALEAKLTAYAITGGRPVPFALIVLVTAVIVVLLVLLVFVAARLLVG